MNNLKTSKVLALVVALAMVLAVVPSFVASAADDEVVLFDMSAIEFTGEVEVGAYGLTGEGHVRLNEKNWKDGAWTNPGEGLGDKTLTFFKSTGGSGNSLIETAAFNNANDSMAAGKIVVDFVFAARDDAKDNYVTWYFEDLDGNAFARFFWDDGTGTWETKDEETEEVIASGQNAEANFGVNETKAIVARGEASRDEVLALRGQAFQVEAVKGDEGYTVTYKKGEEVLGTETIEAINGFKQIKAEIGGWSTQWSGMGLQDLKVVASDFPATIVDVVASYKVGDVEVATEKGTYNSAEAAGYTFPAKTLVYENEVYTAPETTLAQSGDIVMTKVERYASKAVGETVTVKGNTYTVTGGSVVLNGNFVAGKAGWTARTGNAPALSVVADEELGANILTGNTKGAAADESIGTEWAVEAGKTYYIAFDVKTTGIGEGNYKFNRVVNDARSFDFNGNTSGESDIVAFGAEITKDNQWNHVEAVFTAEKEVVTLVSSWVDSISFANVEILPVELAEAGKDASLTYKIAGADDMVVYTGTLAKGDEVTIAGQKFVAGGKIVEVADATLTYENPVVEIEATVVQENAIKSLTTTTGGATRWPDNGGYLTAVSGGDINIVDDDGVALADNADGWSPYGSTRKLTATFDAPKVGDDEVAVLYLAVGAIRKNNGNGTPVAIRAQVGANGAVAYTTALVDSANGTVVKEYVTADVTDLVKAADGEVAIEVTAMAAIALVDETQAGYNGSDAGFASYIAVEKAVDATVDGAATVTVNGQAKTTAYEGAVVRAYNADDEALLINGALEAAAGDELVASEAAAVAAALGFNGDKLTIDFTTAVPGATAVVTSDAGLNTKAAADGVVSVVPANANVTYTVAVQTAGGKAVAGAAAASQALYPLVVADIAANVDAYTADGVSLVRVAAAVKALTEGGAVVDQNDEIKKIAEVSETGVKISDALYKGGEGFGFTVGAKAGSGDAIAAATGEEGKVYQSITFNGDGTVTLEGVDGAVTFSLDSVEIEFVATEVAETAAADADAELDFIPEL